jgi:hypothetical protein
MKNRQLDPSKQCALALVALLAISIASPVAAADPTDWTGEFKTSVHGGGVFELSLEQQGGAIQLSFNAAYSDGHGAAPDGSGTGKMNPKGTVEFTFEDSFSNTGTGIISRAGKDIIVSMKMTNVVEPRCLPFYGENMRLKRATKK